MPALSSGSPAAERSPAERINVAAVCYRWRDGELEFLLVRTRNGHWTFPKGGVDGDASHADAAAREAYEEAGVQGPVERIPFTSYRHRKPRRTRPSGSFVWVHAHLCQVRRTVAPLEGYRKPTWFTVAEAKQRLRKSRKAEFAAEIISVVDLAAERILLG